MINNKKVGLCLSGGGYRAAAYHIGTLRKLKGMGLLDKIDVISSNSGGSITAATYCLSNDWDAFEKAMLAGLRRNMILRLIPRLLAVIAIYVLLTWLLWSNIIADTVGFESFGGLGAKSLLWTTGAFIVLFGFFQYQLLPFSKRNEKSYRNFFVGKKSLKDLPDKPELVMNSTNMETGRPFIFATDQMGDTTYRDYDDQKNSITFDHKDFPVARAIAASTCVPFAFSPVRIKRKFFNPQTSYGRAVPRLVDGGVYDNQGIHRLSHPRSRYACNIIIVSDAGNEMPFKNTYRNVVPLLIRSMDVFMTRIRNLQVIDLLYDSIENKKREIAYQSLGWKPKSSIGKFMDSIENGNILDHVWESHGITDEEVRTNDRAAMRQKLEASVGYDDIVKDANGEEETELARSVGTNLWPLKMEKQNALINHASVMTELQVKLYCPSLV